MKKKEITQAEIAEILGVSQGSVSHWLTGKVKPSSMAIRLIKERLPELWKQLTASEK